jgi:hypothetical protein
MTDVLQKLLFKGQPQVLVLNPPAEFQPHLAGLPGETRVDTSVVPDARYAFAIVFVTRSSEIAALAAEVTGHMAEDGILWFAYPKASSSRYASDVTRDQGWQPLGDLGFEGVSLVAMDDDWSAFRFRHTSFIKAAEPAGARTTGPAAKARAAVKKAVRRPAPKRPKKRAKRAPKKTAKKSAKKPASRRRVKRSAAGRKKTRRTK